jgi:hypothetical protein
MAKRINHARWYEDDDDEAVREPVSSTISEAVAEGRRKGTAEALGRLAAILADHRSKGRERFCIDLACQSPTMLPQDVLAVAVDVQPVSDARAQASWRKVTDAVNARINGNARGSE